jgi:hypothetical protein
LLFSGRRLIVRAWFVHLQDRVGLHLLLNPLLQCQHRKLEDLHRLDDPRR